MELPESWRFLGGMWWVLHVIVISLTFYLGYIIGQARAERDADQVHPHKEESPEP
ncbi:MAG: hypothetical protein PWP23_630 [Candidatus Sumerlaeota bacterium]|nr:hypothetical protein [Candidatus Sumerlaeota bacterium]